MDGLCDWCWIILVGLLCFGEFIEKILFVLCWDSFGVDFVEWFWCWCIWLNLLVEIVFIVFMVMVFGVFGGFVMFFFVLCNFVFNKWVLWICWCYLEIVCMVFELVWVLIFVFCFFVGLMVGVFVIGFYIVGVLGKLYFEVNENIDMCLLEGVKVVGGIWFD